jgi:small-conductance mechanosensitive channel
MVAAAPGLDARGMHPVVEPSPGFGVPDLVNFQMPDFSQLVPALLAAAPTVLVVLIGAILVNVLIGRVLLLVARRGRLTKEEIAPARRIAKWLTVLVAGALILGAFGMNVGGLWGILSTVLAMIAIGFVAVWSVLSNTLCTVMILLFRPFAIGDEIEFAGEPVKGRVVDLNFIFTTLDAGDGSVMQIPNNLFFQKVLHRRHRRQEVSLASQLRARDRHPLGNAASAKD